MVLVSVIIPTYNRATLLDEAIRSVLTQTFSDYEIIVVDDGSSEDIQSVVSKHNDLRLRYEALPRGGVSKARNHGIQVAQGKYVAFLDSDDLFLPEKLQKQVALFEQRPDAGMIYSAYTTINEQVEPQREQPAPSYANYRQMLVACTIATPTVMVRRDILAKVGGFDESMHLAEDIDLWCRIFRFYPILPMQESLTYVRLHDGGTPRDPEAILTAYMYMLIKTFNADRSIPWLDKRRILARIHYITAADIYSRIDPNSKDPNKYHTYTYYYVKAARYYPFSRMGARILWEHYTRGIRAIGRNLKSFITRAESKRAKEMFSAMQAEIETLKAQLAQAVVPEPHDDVLASDVASDELITQDKVTTSDLERVATWLESQTDSGAYYPIFHAHGFHVLRRHYYLPIPEADDLMYAAQPDRLVGISIDEQAAFTFIDQIVKPTKAEFNAFPITKEETQGETDFYVSNTAFMAVDGNIYYGLVRKLKPRRLIEIGSGFSTLLAATAIRRNIADGDSATELTCIEPYPSDALHQLDSFVHVLPTKVQDVDLDLFTSLEAGDILFIDSSHVLRTGNDVWYEYTQILPRLQSGVLVHVHDISLPKPYPQTYFDRQVFWNEQYLLQVMLAHNPRYEVVWAGNYLFTKYPDEMQAVFQPEYGIMRSVYPSSEPSSFWFRIR